MFREGSESRGVHPDQVKQSEINELQREQMEENFDSFTASAVDYVLDKFLKSDTVNRDELSSQLSKYLGSNRANIIQAALKMQVEIDSSVKEGRGSEYKDPKGYSIERFDYDGKDTKSKSKDVRIVDADMCLRAVMKSVAHEKLRDDGHADMIITDYSWWLNEEKRILEN